MGTESADEELIIRLPDSAEFKAGIGHYAAVFREAGGTRTEQGADATGDLGRTAGLATGDPDAADATGMEQPQLRRPTAADIYAARLRLKTDARQGLVSPAWVQRLADLDPAKRRYNPA